MVKPRGKDSFSRSYRFLFRVEYIMLHIFGPSSTNDNRDPRVRSKREYERRRALHEQWLESQQGRE